MMFNNVWFRMVVLLNVLLLTGCAGVQSEQWVSLASKVLKRHQVIGANDAEDMAEAGRIIFGQAKEMQIQKGGK